MDDDDLTPAQERAMETSLRRALDEPMPEQLRSTIATLIEPHTINMYLDHGDVMSCIDVAYPLLRDWLHAHPDIVQA